jgi:hypothetical protein
MLSAADSKLSNQAVVDAMHGTLAFLHLQPASKQQVTFFLSEGKLGVRYPEANTEPVTVGTTAVYR